MILITGANGHLGTAVIEQLLTHVPAEHIVGMVRDADKGRALQQKGVSLRVAEYSDKEALAQAMQDIKKVLLISGGEAEDALQQHYNVVDAAKVAGVNVIAYTSRSLQNTDTLMNPLMKRHFDTEAYIQSSGIDYLLFRNALYMDVIPGFVGKQVFEKGIQLPAGQGKVAYALRSEMGEAIANILVKPAPQHKIFTLTGTEAVSFDDVAAVLSELSGQPVDYSAIKATDFEAQKSAQGLPPALIQKIVNFLSDIAQGQEATVTGELAQALGRKPTALFEGLKQLYSF
jgi:NAD(P)H dehydrogenase (quinone)